MSNPKQLKRSDILRAAKEFVWLRKMPKWTVIVGKRELPARPLVLEAAGVPPNDPTNSHQAVAILENLGFETRYAGNGKNRMGPVETQVAEEQPTDFEALYKMVEEITKEVPDEVWDRLPKDFSKNVDHHLYGTRKKEE